MKEMKQRSAFEKALSRRSFIGQATTALLAFATVGSKAFAQAGKAFNSALELAVNFEIVADGGGRRYKNPYVVVWIENGNGQLIRTVSLWLDRKQKPEWVRELRRWYSSSGDTSSSSATRMPGKYSMVWDGKNDKGAKVNQGDYYICIETAREHGPYNVVREKITIAETPFTKKLPDGGADLSGVSVELRKRA